MTIYAGNSNQRKIKIIFGLYEPLSFIVCLIKRGYRMNLTVNRPVILIFGFLSDYFLKSFIYKPSSMVQKNWKHWVLSQSEKHLKGRT